MHPSSSSLCPARSPDRGQEGTYPAWSPTTIYEKGDRVLLDGRILETR
ncbi:hypothetical protein E3O32_07260 [Cryobacterium mannosilyticum]|uniref:Uncharacterized protein n=1 Tax=Cryobacterium mannosilyticum TaxID=1259190 RepID=A0A4R8W9D7_9MICO|nr:hypothetical protein E3O32_07260 [Cryobacterium mannosilyticum]